VSPGKRLPTFRNNRSPSSASVHMDFKPLAMKAKRSFATVGTTYPVTERHIPEDRNLGLHAFENIRTRTLMLIY
jgi:hypothetical protein